MDPPAPRGSRWRIAAGLVAAAWTLFLTPPVLVAWDGAAPGWAQRADAWAGYDAIRRMVGLLGTHDWYAVFGAPCALSFLLVWWALRPTTDRLGLWGSLLSGSVLSGVPVVTASYLAHDRRGWLRPLWGAELYVLVLVALLAVPAGVVAVRSRRLPRSAAVLLVATLPVMVGGRYVLGYWPHGPLLGLGLEAAGLAGLTRPRALAAVAMPAPRGRHERPGRSRAA